MQKTAKKKKKSIRVPKMKGFIRNLGVRSDAPAREIEGVRDALHKNFGTSRNLGRKEVRGMICDAYGGNGHDGMDLR